jgi:hypothetical protein
LLIARALEQFKGPSWYLFTLRLGIKVSTPLVVELPVDARLARNNRAPFITPKKCGLVRFAYSFATYTGTKVFASAIGFGAQTHASVTP